MTIETAAPPVASPRRRFFAALRRHRVVTSIAALIVLVLAALDVRLFVVPTSDKPGPTDAVVVLGGGTFPVRLEAAIKLADHYPGATLVVSTPGDTPCPAQPPGAAKLICFHPDPVTTQGEAQTAAALAAKQGWTSMTVVTTADQVWRARLRFSRCYNGDLRVVQAPTSMWHRFASVPYEMGATVKAEVFQRAC